VTPPALAVDAHAHLVGLDRDGSGCIVSPAMRRRISTRFVLSLLGAKGSTPARDVDRMYADHLVAQAEAAPSIDRVVLLAFDGVYGEDGRLDERRTNLLVPNDYVFEIAKRSPKLVPACSVNPMRRDALAELDRCAARGAVLVKWIPSAQGFDPSAPRFAPFYARLVALGMPVLSHVGTEMAVANVEKSHGPLERLRGPLDAGVTVIVPHAGGLRLFNDRADWEALLAEMRRYPRLWIDDSALGLIHRRRRLFRVLETPEIHARVIHGSDFPLPPQPLAFADRIGIKEARRIRKIPSFFERDVALKDALGAPRDFLHLANAVLRIPGR